MWIIEKKKRQKSKVLFRRLGQTSVVLQKKKDLYTQPISVCTAEPLAHFESRMMKSYPKESSSTLTTAKPFSSQSGQTFFQPRSIPMSFEETLSHPPPFPSLN